jgi:hypothetical protein
VEVLALNNAHARELSWLEPERLEYLIGEAFLARRIGEFEMTAPTSCGSAPLCALRLRRSDRGPHHQCGAAVARAGL